jgi:hypothetical protein
LGWHPAQRRSCDWREKLVAATTRGVAAVVVVLEDASGMWESQTMTPTEGKRVAALSFWILSSLFGSILQIVVVLTAPDLRSRNAFCFFLVWG